MNNSKVYVSSPLIHLSLHNTAFLNHFSDSFSDCESHYFNPGLSGLSFAELTASCLLRKYESKHNHVTLNCIIGKHSPIGLTVTQGKKKKKIAHIQGQRKSCNVTLEGELLLLLSRFSGVQLCATP